MTIAIRELKVQVVCRGQCKNVCITRVSSAASYEYWPTAVNITFLLSRHQLRVNAANRAAWRGRDQRQRRSLTRVGVVTWSVWPRSLIEDSFSSFRSHRLHAAYKLRYSPLLHMSHVAWSVCLYVCVCLSVLGTRLNGAKTARTNRAAEKVHVGYSS